MRPNNIRIYFQDEHLVVIEKPAGFHVHTPESMLRDGKAVWKNNVSILLRKQLGREVFTVHRLDRATSGVMMFATSEERANIITPLVARSSRCTVNTSLPSCFRRRMETLFFHTALPSRSIDSGVCT